MRKVVVSMNRRSGQAVDGVPEIGVSWVKVGAEREGSRRCQMVP